MHDELILNISDAFLQSELICESKKIGHVYLWTPKLVTTEFGDEYWCYFKIVGFGKSRVDYSIGIDNMQSVILALKTIGTVLRNSKFAKMRKQESLKRWDNFGFPSFDE